MNHWKGAISGRGSRSSSEDACDSYWEDDFRGEF